MLTSASFRQTLENANLGEYWPLFEKNHLDDSLLSTVDVDDLGRIGVASLGHRKRILTLIEKYTATSPAKSSLPEVHHSVPNGFSSPVANGRPTHGAKRSNGAISSGGVNGAPGRSKRLKIAVEGNIASGKSTFLRFLSAEVDFVVVPEPVSKWQNIESADGDEDDFTMSQQSGGNILGMFYGDPKRWAYTFQSYACLSRIKAQMREDWRKEDHITSSSTSSPSSQRKRARTDVSSSPSAPTQNGSPAESAALFFERSVFSDRFCFATNCHESKLFDDTEWNIYCDWHSWLVKNFSSLDIDGFIYLRSSPDTCMRRLKRRARSEESSVDLGYLKRLHEKHEGWLVKKDIGDAFHDQLKDVPILTLQVDKDFEGDDAHRSTLMGKVRDFLAELQ